MLIFLYVGAHQPEILFRQSQILVSESSQNCLRTFEVSWVRICNQLVSLICIYFSPFFHFNYYLNKHQYLYLLCMQICPQLIWQGPPKPVSLDPILINSPPPFVYYKFWTAGDYINCSSNCMRRATNHQKQLIYIFSHEICSFQFDWSVGILQRR